MISSDEQKLKKIEFFSKKLKLSFGDFYASRRENLNGIINELIAYIASKNIGVICPTIKIVKFDNKNYIRLTQNLSCLGKFKTANELGLSDFDNASIFSILNWLQKNFNNSYQLVEGIIRIYLFDIFFMIPDRHNSNWGLLQTKEYTTICMMDNEKMLNTELPPLMESFLPNQPNYCSNYKERRMEDLRFFLKNYDEVFGNLFLNFYDTFTPEYFKLLLDKIEKEEFMLSSDGNLHIKIPLKRKLIEQYQNNYESISAIKKEMMREKGFKK